MFQGLGLRVDAGVQALGFVTSPRFPCWIATLETFTWGQSNLDRSYVRPCRFAGTAITQPRDFAAGVNPTEGEKMYNCYSSRGQDQSCLAPPCYCAYTTWSLLKTISI